MNKQTLALALIITLTGCNASDNNTANDSVIIDDSVVIITPDVPIEHEQPELPEAEYPDNTAPIEEMPNIIDVEYPDGTSELVPVGNIEAPIEDTVGVIGEWAEVGSTISHDYCITHEFITYSFDGGLNDTDVDGHWVNQVKDIVTSQDTVCGDYGVARIERTFKLDETYSNKNGKNVFSNTVTRSGEVYMLDSKSNQADINLYVTKYTTHLELYVNDITCDGTDVLMCTNGTTIDASILTWDEAMLNKDNARNVWIAVNK